MEDVGWVCDVDLEVEVSVEDDTFLASVPYRADRVLKSPSPTEEEEEEEEEEEDVVSVVVAVAVVPVLAVPYDLARLAAEASESPAWSG